MLVQNNIDGLYLLKSTSFTLSINRNSSKTEINFLNNKLNGLAEYWNQNGSKHKSGKFKNGKIMGEWEYFNVSKLDSNLNTQKR